MKNAAIVTAMVLLVIGIAHGEIPLVMNHQGRVTYSNGDPVSDGSYTMRFRIYDNAAGSGSALWDSGNHAVQVSGGIFNVMLGESPHPPLGLTFNQDYWLLMTFAGEDQNPLVRIGSVGYAYMASGLVPGTEVSGTITSGTAAAMKGTNLATSGSAYGLIGESTSTDGSGVFGEATATTGVTSGVLGKTSSTSGTGVRGIATATSGWAYGVLGESSSTGGVGVSGQSLVTTGVTYGVRGDCMSTAGRGVYGVAIHTAGTNYGGYFVSMSQSGRGVLGIAEATYGTNYGVVGQTESSEGRGVVGLANASTGITYGVCGISHSGGGYGVYGVVDATTGYAYGVVGYSASASGIGVLGEAHATSGVTYGVYGMTQSPSGYGGFFDGDVHVTGDITKNNCYFLIDHPLDPENKLLRHSCVESPENLLIYRGTASLNSNGEAAVELPGYFVALVAEQEASVHVTPRGRPFDTGYDWCADRSAIVLYGSPNRVVSWMVLAGRDDPIIRATARPIEEKKGPESRYCDRGELLYPSAFGYPEIRGREYKQRNDARHGPPLRQEE